MQDLICLPTVICSDKNIMNKRNYQKELEKILETKETVGAKLFLHSCCAPCSSYVLTYLCSVFDITVFYYNPNITDDDEYQNRVSEQIRLIDTLNGEGISKYPIKVIKGDYDKTAFYDCAKGLENEPEGGRRCTGCFHLRLERTCKEALANGADYFGTTLTISPLKDAERINNIGFGLENELGAGKLKFLPSDFKKKDGYKTSIELSKKYNLYRQDYCGCEFGKMQGKEQKDKLL